MGQALYRKYRSKSLAEIVGQEHITETLERAIKGGRISHAYLFTGPRGVGKTSIARILAHEINDLPYTDDSVHIDIIEIDAASNRRIDEIRDLRDKVYIAPTSARYKVYIIDEVHMLTKEAFNALLKTLEEPPEHVVFILATTEAHKLPETIVSRTQRYVFRPVEIEKVIAHLRSIATQEKIKIDDEALRLIAEHGEGSFRDSISLLDQAGNQGKDVGIEEVQSLLGVPPGQAVGKLLSSITRGDMALLLTELNGMYQHGYQPASIAKQLASQLRRQLVDGVLELPLERTTALLAKLINVPASHDPERYLEIILLEALPANTAVHERVEPKATPSPKPKLPPEEPKKVAKEEPKAPEPDPVKDNTMQKAKSAAVETPQAVAVLDEALWPQILTALKHKHNTLYGVVRMAQPIFTDDGKLELQFAFAFHQKRLNEPKNRQKVGDIIKVLTGRDVELVCVFNKDAKPVGHITSAVEQPAPVVSSSADSAPLATISNIFGGGELLES